MPTELWLLSDGQYYLNGSFDPAMIGAVPMFNKYFASDKVTAWADKQAARKFFTRKFPGRAITETENRLEVIAEDGHTYAMVRFVMAL